jgi:hypothetical protein
VLLSWWQVVWVFEVVVLSELLSEYSCLILWEQLPALWICVKGPLPRQPYPDGI